MPFEKSPCVNQTEADIGAYYRSAKVGAEGQTTLVVPTLEIKAWMKANPTGKMNVSVFP